MGTFYGDPLYSQSQNDPHDIAVVVLAVRFITPATLPTAESLSALPKGQRVTSVGYGAYDVVKAQGAGDTITGDYVCRAANVTCRLDTASARNFLEEYVALP